MFCAANLCVLNGRLKALTGRHADPFGGMNIILFGDDGQLRPIGGGLLYGAGEFGKRRAAQIHARLGQRLYQDYFRAPHSLAVVLNKVHRQHGDSAEAIAFRAMLMRLRDAVPNDQDLVAFESMFCQTADLDEDGDDDGFCDGTETHLFFDNFSKGMHNNAYLQRLSKPVRTFRAEHQGHGDEDAAGASSLDSSSFQGLVGSLSLCVGARVMLNHNLWVSRGLVNGARGVVTHIVLPDKAKAAPGRDADMTCLPECVIVKFDFTAEHLATFPLFGSLPRGSVPIFPLTVDHERKGTTAKRSKLKRTQLPLTLAAALTVHKSQGQTMNRVVLHLPDTNGDPTPGFSYVAMSRVKGRHGFKMVSDHQWDVVKPRWGNLKGNINDYTRRINQDEALRQRSQELSSLGFEAALNILELAARGGGGGSAANAAAFMPSSSGGGLDDSEDDAPADGDQDGEDFDFDDFYEDDDAWGDGGDGAGLLDGDVEDTGFGGDASGGGVDVANHVGSGSVYGAFDHGDDDAVDADIVDYDEDSAKRGATGVGFGLVDDDYSVSQPAALRPALAQPRTSRFTSVLADELAQEAEQALAHELARREAVELEHDLHTRILP
jgi:hypothetical protein